MRSSAALNCALLRALVLTVCFAFFPAAAAQAMSLTLEWDAPPEQVDGYLLHYKSGSPGGPYNGTGADQGGSPINVGSSTSVTLTGLDSSGKYYMAVTSYSGQGESNYSNEVTAGPVIYDTSPPSVSSVSPSSGVVGVAPETQISVRFNEAMDSSTMNSGTFLISGGVEGSVSYDPQRFLAVFKPAANLDYATSYTATVTSGARDAAGNALSSNYSWSFETSATPDFIPPSVSAVSPSEGISDVSVGTVLSVDFSEPMAQASMVKSNFSLNCGGVDVPFTLSYSGVTATMTHSGLNYGSLCTAGVSSTLTDLAGNALPMDYFWNFSTVTKGPGNSPPYRPYLISPKNGTRGQPHKIKFSWQKAEDPDGDTVSHYLYYGTSPALEGGDVRIMQIDPGTYGAAHGMPSGPLSGIMLVGFVAAGTWTRRRRRVFLASILILASLFLVQCGVSSQEPPAGSGGTLSPSNVLDYDLSGLEPSTLYYWKVVARDSLGAETASDTWSFTTN